MARSASLIFALAVLSIALGVAADEEIKAHCTTLSECTSEKCSAAATCYVNCGDDTDCQTACSAEITLADFALYSSYHTFATCYASCSVRKLKAGEKGVIWVLEDTTSVKTGQGGTKSP